MRVQGQYMGAIRPLSAAQRAQVKKLRAEKGAEAAIALARKLAGQWALPEITAASPELRPAQHGLQSGRNLGRKTDGF
jgi:hypothetical protein